MSVRELRRKYEAFVSNLDVNIALAVEGVEQQLTDLNRRNLLDSKDSFDAPLKHNRTGKTTLSPAYAKRMGKTNPDIYVRGDYQDDMFLSVNENTKEYSIQSNDYKHPFLTENYNNLTGVPASKREQAKKLTSRAIGQLLISKTK